MKKYESIQPNLTDPTIFNPLYITLLTQTESTQTKPNSTCLNRLLAIVGSKGIKIWCYCTLQYFLNDSD